MKTTRPNEHMRRILITGMIMIGQIQLLKVLPSVMARGWSERTTMMAFQSGSSINRVNNRSIHPQPISRHSMMMTQRKMSSSSTTEEKEDSTLIKSITKDGVYIVESMPPSLPKPLKNTYYLLRHGQSWGNVEGVISSARSLATSEKHGLTPLGYKQGKDSAKDLLQCLSEKQAGEGKKRRVFFYSSPFARARQTAKACMDGVLDGDENEKWAGDLNLDIQEDIIIEDGIMERFFGRLDDEAIHTYAYVWPVDMFDVTHTAFEVESVAAVCTRVRETILKLEEKPLHNNDDDDDNEGDIIILTSHADVLQIMQVYAAGMKNVGLFSSYRFANGEVREMAQNLDSLPEPQPLQPPKIGT